jgi:hypothetical protein
VVVLKACVLLAVYPLAARGSDIFEQSFRVAPSEPRKAPLEKSAQRCVRTFPARLFMID